MPTSSGESMTRGPAVEHWFRSIDCDHDLVKRAHALGGVFENLAALRTELCFNVEVQYTLQAEEIERLEFLLAETFEPTKLTRSTTLNTARPIVEVGPRLNFASAFSTHAVGICRSCHLNAITRIEQSSRYELVFDQEVPELDASSLNQFASIVHDRMTQQRYLKQLQSFAIDMNPAPVYEVDVIGKGKEALKALDREMGLAFDAHDLEYYTTLFRNRVGRNPTNVECFDVAQSNSEHCRHWFFRGNLVRNGQKLPKTLWQLVTAPYKANPNNSVIAFHDNSSAIRGHRHRALVASDPSTSSSMHLIDVDYDITLTAETHNFPCGVAPFPGAETGTGGRIRDGHATGRGSLIVGGIAAYCVGNLNIPGYELPWEDSSMQYPDALAPPLRIAIEASNGASDYGNKFGEPVIAGYFRSFGLRLNGEEGDSERREWLKPIMFSAGIGHMDTRHLEKGKPEPGMLIVKLGGPAYRIGMGGGAASSMVQGENAAELDFNAVQRGDAQMEQKVNRVIRACVELGDANPIISIHDQGAGGTGNVLKEIVEPTGGRIEIRDILCGDETLSVLEIWAAEYQENDALLIRPASKEVFRSLCMRENAPFRVVGQVTDDGRVVVHDRNDGSTPFNLPLEDVLGDMPPKTFEFGSPSALASTLRLPESLNLREALGRVLRLPAVGSKRFLTTKVDRSVTGLIAQQQCVGPLQLTLADVAVIALGYNTFTGAATAVGEQPLKGLLSPAAMARLAVGEALTNLVWARVTALEDVRASANWMYAAKLAGEGSAMYEAASAMSEMMISLGIAVDGGKDSLSMAACVGDEVVMAPGQLCITAYCSVSDIRMTVSPDLKHPRNGALYFVPLDEGNARLGGSALAHAFGQIGEHCPDLKDPSILKKAFQAIQELIGECLISAGHDRSDGGLITTVLEMAFAGNCGVELDLASTTATWIEYLFSEELGLVIEIDPACETRALAIFDKHGVTFQKIGKCIVEPVAIVRFNGETILDTCVLDLRNDWEATSFEIEKKQATPSCVQQEQAGLKMRRSPPYELSFEPVATVVSPCARPRVAIVREEGSNGDREMAAAFYEAGFDSWDVHINDLLEQRIDLASFRGIAFVGGFSHADTFDSAKGWAGSISFNPKLKASFDAFYNRTDTFSLGVCNGCQLMALLGWVPFRESSLQDRARFIKNESGRFESRFTTVRIKSSSSVLFKGMEGSTLGVWSAHGEGRAFFPKGNADEIMNQKLAPLVYVDDDGVGTEEYPFNPNGSPLGIAALCSPDGRHLAMMPHPERCFLSWQLPYTPPHFQHLQVSPWLRLFQNARAFCDVSH